MTRHAAIATAAFIVLTAGVARAEEPQKDNFSGLASGAAVFLGLELAPAVLLVTDLVARPQSRGYGAAELSIGVTAAAVNTWFAIDFALTPNCVDCSDVTPYLLGIAAFDLACAAHGAYLLLRDEPTSEVTIIPTLVTDGKATAPGLGLGGTF
ncbi:MAG: hypothetical protein H0T42_11945 [Deltaproteobacteria bacterium]|nr:hypothetical protein [Deltaproteobacteria bacterium]